MSRNRSNSGLLGHDKQKCQKPAYRGHLLPVPGELTNPRRGEPADLIYSQSPGLLILYHSPKHSHFYPHQVQGIPDCKPQISKHVPTNRVSTRGGPDQVEGSLEGFLEEKKESRIEKAQFGLLLAKKSVHSLIPEVSICIGMAWGAC